MSTQETGIVYPKFRWVIAVIFIFVSMLGVFFMVATAPIMTIMMEDLNTNLVMMGYASTIVTMMSGVFLFIGVIFIAKWGLKKCFILSTFFLTLGNIICMLSGTIGLLIFGRGLVGIGFGISGALVGATVFMWFPATERPLIFSANALACTASMLVAYNAIVPMYEVFGSWKTIFTVCAGVSVFAMLLWIFLGREFSANPQSETVKVNPFDGLTLAFKSKQLWMLSIMMTTFTVMQFGINFYYPTFLAEIRGFGTAAASSVTSIQFIAGAIGSFVGGIVAVALGKRKPILIPACIATLATLVGLFIFNNVALLITMMFAFGLIFNLRNPAAQTASTEVKGMNAAMASGANSMMFGFGSLLTIFISPVLGALQKTIGLTGAMLVFCMGLAIIGIVPTFFMKETGPKAEIN